MYIIMTLLILLNILILGVQRISITIKILIFQGLLIGLIPILRFEKELVILGVTIIILKAIIFPTLLFNISKKLESKTEENPYVSYTLSSLLGIIFFLVAYKISSIYMAPIFVIIVGLFLIITRKQAINQVIGFLIFESGIFLLGSTIAAEFPIVMEIAILLDVVTAVLVMVLSIDKINKCFAHTDIDKLDSLKG